ncbi:MAG TPA: hypothetical protein PLJ78_14890 [Anaerolineae bacterium]|nr:hypothetical protein [Anaerolineae bacterium]HQK15217.1 hypothetical protein [Anaerolineae bacterium]
MYTEDVRQILEMTIADLENRADFPESLVAMLKVAYEQNKLHDPGTLRQMLNAALKESQYGRGNRP